MIAGIIPAGELGGRKDRGDRAIIHGCIIPAGELGGRKDMSWAFTVATDAILHLKSVDSVNGYIKQPIRKSIEKGN